MVSPLDKLGTPTGQTITPVTQGGMPPTNPRKLRDLGYPIDGTDESPTTQEMVTDALRAARENIENLTVDQVVTYLKENGELPGGLGGAIAGSIIGFLSPMPGGMLIGGILGGAAGTMAGSLASDAAMDQPLDVGEAALKGGESLAIDALTLGGGKFAKGGYKLAKRALTPGKRDLKEVAEIATEGATLGRQASPSVSNVTPAKAQSQVTLSQQGASLTPYQVGNIASSWEQIKENIGRAGFLSKMVFESNTNEIKRIATEQIDKIIDTPVSVLGGGPTTFDVVGRGISAAFHEANVVLQKEYGDAYKKIGQQLSKKTFEFDPIRKNIDNWLNRPENIYKDSGRSKLQDGTLEVVKAVKDLLIREDTGAVLKKGSGQVLLDIEHALNQAVTKHGQFGSPSFNPAAARELASLSKRIKVFNRKTIRSADPKVAKEFTALQKNYGETINSIYPTINQRFITSANAENFSALGAMFTLPGKLENIQAVMKSLEVAYKTLPKSQADNLTFRTVDDAKNEIRRSYLQAILPKDLATPKDLNKYVNLADVLKNNPNEAKKMREVLGPKFTSFERAVNLLAAASEKPTSGLATLFMRGREFGAVSQMASVAALGGLAAADFITIGGAGASIATILGGPVMLARAATNPKYVNDLIKIDKQGKNPSKVLKMSGVLINKVVDDMIAEGYEAETILELLTRDKE